MTNVNAYVPANIYDFYKIIKGFSQLSFIPTDKLFELMGIQQDEISDAQKIFMDLGPFIIVLLVGCALLILLVLLKVFTVVFCCFGNVRLKKVYKNLRSYLFWTATLRYFLESYIKMTLFSITLALSGLDWSSNLK
jgi:hypothetical protein